MTTVGFAVRSAQLATELGIAATTVAASALAHRKDKAKAVAQAKTREKAKSRVRRFVISGMAVIPFSGMLTAPAIAGSFEVADFNDWKTDNPERGFGDYVCETGEASAELVDEVLQELPELLRPHPDTVRSWMPQCGVPLEAQPWRNQ